MSRLKQRRGRLVAAGMGGLLVLASTVLSSAATKPEDASEFLVVDCMLPGQVRKLGAKLTYVTARRPVRTSAVDCEIRGGEYVAYDRADYRTSLNIWLPQAKEGDPEAMANVGEIYEKGLGTTPDYEAAAYWYKQAADKDFTRAQTNLGYLYEMGLGVDRDPKQALFWYRRASGLQGEIDLSAAAVPVAAVPPPSEEKVAQLQSEVDALRAESDSLRNELARAREVLKQPAPAPVTVPVSRPDPAAQQELAAVKATLSQREQELAELDKLLAQTRDELAVNREELKRREQLVASKDARLDETQAALSASQAQLEARIGQLSQLEKEMARQRDVDLEQAQQTTSASAEEIARRDAKLAALDAELARTRSELAAARAEFSRQQQQAAASNRQLAEAQQVAARSQAELTQRVAELNRLEQQLEKQRAESAAGAEQIEQLQARVADLESEQARQQEVDKTKQLAMAEKLVAGPSLTLIDPVLSPTRGDDPLVFRSAVESRQIVGMVQAPAGLLTLTVNDETTEPNPQGVFTRKLTLRSAMNPVSIVAIDNQGKRSSLGFSFNYERGALASDDTSVAQGEVEPPPPDIDFGDYHALIIGNNDYQTMVDLRTPINDARELAKVLNERYGVKTTVLLDATRYQILSALNDMRTKLTSHDNLLIYYAGHGVLDEVNMRGQWLPVDAEPDNSANWISNVSITDMLNVIQAKQILVISDSCYSGSLTRSANPSLEGNQTEEERLNWLKTMSEKKARMVLTSGGLEPVLDSAGGNHSVFAKALLDVLNSNTDVLEGRRLYREVAARVAYSAAQVGFDQVPEYAPIRFAGHESGEFFLVPRG